MNRNFVTDPGSRFRRGRNGGFSLIELMITVVIAAILLAVAIPGFRSIIQNNRLVTSANQLVTGLTVARSEAVKRGREVVIRPTTGTNWSTGWQVRVDLNDDGDVDDSLELLHGSGALEGGASLSGGPAAIAFQPSGRVDVAACFDLTIPDSSAVRSIDVANTGRVDVDDSACP